MLGTTYHILDDADIIAEALVAQGYRDGMDQFVISREDEAEILGGPLFPQLPDGMSVDCPTDDDADGRFYRQLIAEVNGRWIAQRTYVPSSFLMACLFQAMIWIGPSR